MSQYKKPVLITGGTGLLGEAIADVFADKNHRVVITSREFDSAAGFCDNKNTDEDTDQWVPLEVNLASSESILMAVETLDDMELYPSFVIANASSRDALGSSFDDISHDDFLSLFRVDVAGHMILTRELRKTAPPSSLASVTFMSSIYAIQGVDNGIYPEEMMPTPIHYSAVKSAMTGLVQSLAAQWGPSTRVNVIISGGAQAEERQNDQFTEAYSDKTMLDRLAQPREVADAVYFLSSNNAGYITGNSLVVDGGYSAWWPSAVYSPISVVINRIKI